MAHTDTSGFETDAFKKAALANGGALCITRIRPSNVDNAEMMTKRSRERKETPPSCRWSSLHPRTRNNLEKFGIDLKAEHHAMGPAYALLNLWK